MKPIPYSHHWLDEDDIQAVVDVLRSDWITQGPKIEEFEKVLASYCGANYAVAVSSGTAALHLACLAAGIKEGDEVVTSPITFVASANCILYCGGKPVFVDVQPDTINIDPQKIRGYLNSQPNSQSQSKSSLKAIIPIHFAGHPCDLEEISHIAKEHNLVVIEDAAHALGAEYKVEAKIKVKKNSENQSQSQPMSSWVKVGSCRHSDMTVFSFHPVKSITTGEGGAVLTNNEQYYEKLLMLRNHGITKNRAKFKVKENDSKLNLNLNLDLSEVGSWYYEMQELGYNYRLTDFQSALGIKQLEKLDKFIERRREIAAKYNEVFKDIEEIITPCERENVRHSYHLYVIQLKKGLNRKEIFESLRKQGLGVQVHYIPVHLQPYYQQRLGYKKGDYPKAEQFYENALSLPLFPKMSDREIIRVINVVKKNYKNGNVKRRK